MLNNELQLKRAEHTDIDLLFSWINDPEVRAQSLSGRSISYNEHTEWFSKKLSDKNCYLYIVYKNTEPAGMIRFDLNDDECTVSYLVDKLQRGKGIGDSIIYKGIDKFINESNFKGWLKADVKNTNPPSLKIFKNAGFETQNVDEDIIHFQKLIV